MAIYAHGTEFNQIFIFEFILGAWPSALALTILLKQRKEA